MKEEFLNHFSEALKFLCFECTYNLVRWHGEIAGLAVEPRELKSLINVLHELGLSYEETVDAMNGVVKEVRSVRHLWRKGDNSWLIKVGLALLAFPDPTLSDILGSIILSAGLIQKRMRQASLGIEDVCSTFQGIIRDLQTIKRGLTE